MLKYLTVFDPSKTSELDNEAQDALLLYHEFDSLYGCSLNDKLSRIGIIQGIWTMTQAIGGAETETEGVVELDEELIITIFVESQFFITLCVSTNRGGNDNLIPGQVPSHFYVNHLWLSYKFFLLQYGTFKSLYDVNDDISSNKLTDLLNEHMVPFWNDIYLKPLTLIRRGLDSLWHNSYKRAEFDLTKPTAITDDRNLSVPTTKEQSWDSMILRDIILNEESFPGVVDILIYNLPNVKDQQVNGSVAKKEYGLIRNFTSDFQNLPDLSNWLYHLHSSYGTISNHTITGNMHFKERIVDTENNSLHNANSENIHSDVSSHRTIGSNTQNGDVTNEQPEAQQTLMHNISSYSNKFLHNVTLPISFAYDAVQEMGTTTGISNSISLFKDYIPRWSTEETNASNRNELRRGNIPRHGFLISPLASDKLPKSYKVKTLNLNFTNQEETKFNTLFWFYNDILVLIVCRESFDKIWDTTYLIEMDNLLTKSMVQFYEEVLKVKDPRNIPSIDRDFAYTIVDKTTDKQTIRCSIPPFLTKNTINALDNENSTSPFDLVFTGMDNLLSINDNNPLSLNSMGNLFGFSSYKESVNKDKQDQAYDTFLTTLSDDQLWELQNEIISILEAIRNSRRNKKQINEERLITLNNGLLCYVRESDQRLILIIKNWFDMKKDQSNTRKKTLLGSLGEDVTKWWEQFS